jgi:hypothetical protein
VAIADTKVTLHWKSYTPVASALPVFVHPKGGKVKCNATKLINMLRPQLAVLSPKKVRLVHDFHLDWKYLAVHWIG